MTNLKNLARNVLAAALVAFGAGAGPAAAVTVVNGDFDSTSGPNGAAIAGLMSGGASWRVFDALEGWTKGADDAGIELQSNRTLSKIDAHSGDFYVELDSHSNSSMTQILRLDAGVYLLEFQYSPRTASAASNGIAFGIDGVFRGLVTGPGETPASAVGEWTPVSTLFEILAPGRYALTFAAAGKSDSYGGLIDSVALGALGPNLRQPSPPETSAVPAPGGLALLPFAIGGLVAAARRRRRA